MGTTGTHSEGVPTVGYCVRRAGGEVLAEQHADLSFYAASTVKLAVLAAAARALDAGSVALDTPLTSTDTFASDAPGAPDYRIDPDDVDDGLPAPGTPMPFGDVVERMIVVSSNEATNMVSELVGLSAVAAVLADAGAVSTTYQSKYSDFAAAASGARRDTTAGDLAALMSAIVTGSLVDATWTAWMTAMLGRQSDRLLTAEVGAGVECGSKSGSVDGIRHDVAFIGAPGPDAVVIAVCTRGFDEPAADRLLTSFGALTHTLASTPRPR